MTESLIFLVVMNIRVHIVRFYLRWYCFVCSHHYSGHCKYGQSYFIFPKIPAKTRKMIQYFLNIMVSILYIRILVYWIANLEKTKWKPMRRSSKDGTKFLWKCLIPKSNPVLIHAFPTMALKYSSLTSLNSSIEKQPTLVKISIGRSERVYLLFIHGHEVCLKEKTK